MENQNNTIQHLAEIRNMMERSSRFISLSGMSGVASGLTALAGWSIACWGVGLEPRFSRTGNWIIPVKTGSEAWPVFMVAILVLFVAITASILFTIRNSARKGLKAWDTSAKRLILHLSFPLLTGGLFCLILIQQELLFLLIPASLIFYGLALAGAARYTLHEIRILGIIQVVLGLLSGLLPSFSIVLWAFGFGVMHIVYGWLMVVRYEAEVRKL